MNTNPLLKLRDFGQSIWLDFIRRGMLSSGEFQSFIDDDGILGVTSNPSIFGKVITGSHDYDEAIRAASLEGKTSAQIYQLLTVPDIQKATDLLHRTFEATKGRDGFVSLEVSPHLAYDTEGTVTEARKLWRTLARPNALIKVPGTAQGIPAIRQLISEGINVNVTLLFGIDRYLEAAEAYIEGLEIRVRKGKPIAEIASVASFFLSRIDVAVDKLLPPDSRLRGQIAIASAKVAYQKYKEIFASKRFEALIKQGAKTQRLLWASTGTKNATDSDVKYIEALIGPETVNTVPLETLNAYRDHGDPANRLETDLTLATNALELLGEMTVDLGAVTQQLEGEGVQKFTLAFDQLMSSLEIKRMNILSGPPNGQPLFLANCEEVAKKGIARLQGEDYCHRVWRKDPSLWKSDLASQTMIKNSLGWLHIASKMEGSPETEIKGFVYEIREAGFEHVVHMGMGGSSLAALVFARTFTVADGLPLTVLDTTDPATIEQIESQIPLERTLFIVASKSGDTAEPLAFKDYFYDRIKAIKGKKAGDNFVAITDPGSPLARMAKDEGFRRVFLNASDIGGRYSALSYFGLVPAALMGVNIGEILSRALRAVHSSMSCVAYHESPALVLGALFGEMAKQRKNKITLLVEKPMTTLGLWLEQLMAESTGKEGKGLIPICDEPLGNPKSYGDDRLFVHLTVKDSAYKAENASIAIAASDFRQAGYPVVTIEMPDSLDLGQEFFRWEYAVAVAGSLLGINAFDQPNVQESKDNTNRLLSQVTDKPNLQIPTLTEGSLHIYSGVGASSAAESLNQFLKMAEIGDYVALLAFLPETDVTYKLLQDIRGSLREKLKLATTLGYGPRFLHSTGQLHKGGPNTGIFIQLTADNPSDVPIPGRPYSFGVFKRAEAQGDLEALRKHNRRVMRIHLSGDIERALIELRGVVDAALSASFRSAAETNTDASMS